ncbi:MAG: hypothetical protein EH224_13555 [Calditrichaeota bacterium]|nr:MAG: hypothetical protein EH224_13555 [Calditrichota bacterium]
MKRLLILISILTFLTQGFGQRNDLFEFESDVRLFTAYAFINACGYDFDYDVKHYIRVQTRNHIDSVLSIEFKQRIRKFYKATGLDWTECAEYAINLSSDGEFYWQCDTCNNEIKNKYSGLDSLYRLFYQRADIDSIFKIYKPIMDSINYSYKPYSIMAINHIIDFLKVNNDYYNNYTKGLYYSKMPLMSNFTGFTFTSNGTLYMIYGPPMGNPGPDSYYHEAIHPAIGGFIDENVDKVYEYSELNEIARKQLHGNYNGTKELFEESCVRAIDKYLTGKYYKKTDDEILKTVEQEYKLGFIFTLYVYEKLKEYESSSMTFKDYLPILITGIDLNKEKNRYNEFWTKNK